MVTCQFDRPVDRRHLSIFDQPVDRQNLQYLNLIAMSNRKDNSIEYKLYYIDKCLRLGLHITTFQWNKKTASFVTKNWLLATTKFVTCKSVLRTKSSSSYESKCLSMFGCFLVGHSLLRRASFSTVCASMASAESRFLFSETVLPLPLKCLGVYEYKLCFFALWCSYSVGILVFLFCFIALF